MEDIKTSSMTEHECEHIFIEQAVFGKKLSWFQMSQSKSKKRCRLDWLHTKNINKIQNELPHLLLRHGVQTRMGETNLISLLYKASSS